MLKQAASGSQLVLLQDLLISRIDAGQAACCQNHHFRRFLEK
jgi:hypothetical protein